MEFDEHEEDFFLTDEWTAEDADEFFSFEEEGDYSDPYGWDEPAEYPF